MAPSFRLPDERGATVSLDDLRGRWVVLYFYPRDDTPGCTVEACEFTALRAAFTKLGADVFGCSGDSASSHAKFVSKHALGIRLLTDADRSVMKAYGAFGKKVMYGKEVVGVIRSTVLIDPDGKVAHHWAKVKSAGHAAAVRDKLVELRGGGGPIGKAPAKAAKPKVAAARKPAVRARASKSKSR